MCGKIKITNGIDDKYHEMSGMTRLNKKE